MRPDSLLIIVRVIADFAIYLLLCAKPSRNLTAENLFLRKQLALYKERQIKPRSTYPATRFTMAFLSQRFRWRDALVIVQPRTIIRWHRQCRIELIQACKFPRFSYDDVRIALCEDYGLTPETYYATGVRAPDSPMRMTAISKYGTITHSKYKFHAVWDWKKGKLLAELRANKVPLPIDYKLFSRSWDGMDLRFIWNIRKY